MRYDLNKEKKVTSRKKVSTDQFLFLKWVVISALWVGTAFGAYLLYVFHDLPSIDKLDTVARTRRITITDGRNVVLATYGDIYGYYVPYDEIPRNLRNAVIATEDRKFYSHFGVDIVGIIRAFFANLKAGHTVQGGSTITQQLAKIVFLKPTRSLKRKLQEALLAIELEMRYSKKQILAIYLNRVYLGSGIYGIDAAAKYYFGKNIHHLNLYEAAIIAGLLKAPSQLAPTRNSEKTGYRAYQVLQNMYEERYISKDRLDEALNQPVVINTAMLGSKRDYFTDWIYEQVNTYVPADLNHDLIIKTTLDSRVQNASSIALNAQLNEIAETRRVAQGATVVLDYNGKVLSMVGGRNAKNEYFNRATQALRQAGSAFKVFVYAAAMEHGMLVEDQIEDKPVAFGKWSPKNFNKDFLGMITLQEAFAKSINTIAVRLTNKVGVKNVIETAKRMGINSPIEPNLSIALGTSSVTLLEITAALGSIANHGYLVSPHAISSIIDNNTGQLLYTYQVLEPQMVLSEDATNKMNILLETAVNAGTARNAAVPQFQIRGKTGTSQDFRDAWFLGYTDKYIIGVWLGNDDYTPTKYVSGGTYPAVIAKKILKTIQ